MNARKIMLAMVVVVTLALSAVIVRAHRDGDTALYPAAAGQGDILDVLERFRQAQSQRLEGSWEYTISPQPPPGIPAPPPFRTYLSYARGGAVTGADRSRPFAGALHGSWAHLGGDEFATTTLSDQFDMMGNFLGSIKVRTRITLTGADKLVGIATAEDLNPAGTVVATRCATFRAERIKIEPLAPQCQSLTPPQ